MMNLTEIQAAIPHRPPFLFVDEVLQRDEKRIVCRKTFRGDEWFYAGHYPQYPITPGVVLCEAAMQAGALLLAQFEPHKVSGVPVAARMNDVRFKRVIKPGETIEMQVELTHQVTNAWFFKGKVLCGGELAVRLEFTCAVAPVT